MKGCSFIIVFDPDFLFINNKIEKGKMGRPKQKYCSYDEFKEILIEYNIVSLVDYAKRYKYINPKSGRKLPGAPRDTYLSEGIKWEGWKILLVENKEKYYLYDDFKKMLYKNNIKNGKEYYENFKNLNLKSEYKFPAAPSVYYNNEWKGWYRIFKKNIYSYEELKVIVNEKNIKTIAEYSNIYKLLENSEGIKAVRNPNTVFKSEWKNWGEFLWEKEYYSYNELKKSASESNIKTGDEYKKRYNELGDKAISCPQDHYPEWESWGEFLGTGSMASINREFLCFEEARDWVRLLKLRCYTDFKNLENIPINIPKNPHAVYKESGWLGQSDWVGVKNKSVFLGELIIKDYLDKNNLKYKNNASIVGCKYKYPLKFDFILEKENICIEYDGIQHFNPVSYWGGEKRLNDSKKRDETKNKFCEDNNIKMIRIPYWLKNEEIYEILNKELLTN